MTRALFATLLLSDVWTAAKEPRQGSKGRQTPFTFTLDEFQEFVTPTIAKNLDQARGFGLHLTLAHQFPRQLKTAGAHGEQLYDSVMENGRNKVVFHLSYDLEDITKSLFLGSINPDEIKHEIHSMKVVGQHEETRTTYTRNRTSGVNASKGETIDKRRDNEWSDGEETGKLTVAENEMEIDTFSEGEVEGTVMIQDFERELSSVQFRTIEEQILRARKILFDQKQRQCMVRLTESRVPAALFTPTVTTQPVSARSVQRITSKGMSAATEIHDVLGGGSTATAEVKKEAGHPEAIPGGRAATSPTSTGRKIK